MESEPDFGLGVEYINTNIMRRLVARMQNTHLKRGASVFVGPPGIGKTMAAHAFMRGHPGRVIKVQVMKKGATGTLVLKQLLLALRENRGHPTKYVSNATDEVLRYIGIEIEKLANGWPHDARPWDFPKLTVIFDEAQRLSRGAIDMVRDYNEPHFQCRGMFPIGLIFIGNHELSLRVADDGSSVFDAGMSDRLLYREQLTYDDLEPADFEAFAKAHGVEDEGIVNEIVRRFIAQNRQLSFRQFGRVIGDLYDEALDGPITAETIEAVFGPIPA